MTHNEPVLEPLPMRHRRRTFLLLVSLFILSLPFLYLYATGYRFEFGENANFISTGGIYVAAERAGASIFIDGELVRETRVFRRAFYAQSLEPGTHRVHVQKEDHHTWVKELPVVPHLVTEAQAFNLPIVPQVRIISSWQSATGAPVVDEFLLVASSTNGYFSTSTKATTSLKFTRSIEFESLLGLFSTSSATSTDTFAEIVAEQIGTLFATSSPTSTVATATSTKEWRGVRLHEVGSDLFATWVGSLEDLPYYYCADDFPRYSSSTEEDVLNDIDIEALVHEANEDPELVHPIQVISEDVECDPTIQIHTQFQKFKTFDFFPDSTDFVVLALEDGIYVVEIDDRGWQNVQPLLLGENLDMRVENGQIYVYDGELIYEVIVET